MRATFSGSASYNFDRSFDRDERSISIVVVGHSDYSRREVKDVQLTKPAALMLDAKDYPSFISECGSYYVAIERRGVTQPMVTHSRAPDGRTGPGCQRKKRQFEPKNAIPGLDRRRPATNGSALPGSPENRYHLKSRVHPGNSALGLEGAD